MFVTPKLSTLATILVALLWAQALRADDSSSTAVLQILRSHCFDCHAHGERSGEVALDAWADVPALLADRQVWERVRRVVSRHEMPPAEATPLSEEERSAVVSWIDQHVLHIDCDAPDPGRVTVRRLNRNEYRRTIRDLLHVSFETDQQFPVDPSGHGFDNIGDVLTMPPVLMEKYLKAAEQIAGRVIVTPEERLPTTKRFPPDLLEVGYNARQQGNGWVYLNSIEEDDLVAVYQLPVGGEYKFRVHAYAQQEGERPIELTFLLADRVLETRHIAANDAQIYETLVHVPPGENRFRVAVRRIKDGLPLEQAAVWKEGPTQDGAVLVEWLEIEGPVLVCEGDLTESHRTLFAPAAGLPPSRDAATKIFAALLPRAFRRDVSEADVHRIVAIAEASWQRGGSFEAGIQDALTAVLVAPRFLYRLENVAKSLKDGQTAPLDDFSLASRLSYFLWGSMPDDELLAMARQGRLGEIGPLKQQVRRMLADPKSISLVEDFAGQWLELRNLSLATPDANRFPQFDELLRAAMRRETEMLFNTIVREDGSIIDLIGADYTYVNERLARHYGMEGIEGDEFRRVSLARTTRRGLLTHASILTLTSNPTRTSPVKRGKWVLENLLGAPPPPPPPNVPQLDDKQNVDQTLPLRERLEQHRRDPNCASCHRRMDSIGFALEHFNAIGAYRDSDSWQPIDASGELYAGEEFSDAASLVELLATKHRDRFARCMAEKMLTYALGRGLEIPDQCAVDDLVKALQENEYRFSSLVTAIVESAPFRYTRIGGQ